MSKEVKASIKVLKAKLPKRGYAVLIKKELISQGKRRFSIGKIHNLFNFKEVNPDDKQLIVSAAKKVISQREKQTKKLLKMMAK